MAKISELKFDINGENFKVPVNVGSDGVFKAKLPPIVSNAFNCLSEIRKPTLEALTKEFYSQLHKFKKAQTKREYLIAIRYGASGFYQKNSNDAYMFGDNNRTYKVEMSFGGMDVVGLEFEIILKEDIDGSVNFFNVETESGNAHLGTNKPLPIEEWTKRGKFYLGVSHKLIPYNAKHFNTLCNARENMRKLSELLFRFIDQDSEQIQNTLSTGKLLLLK